MRGFVLKKLDLTYLIGALLLQGCAHEPLQPSQMPLPPPSLMEASERTPGATQLIAPDSGVPTQIYPGTGALFGSSQTQAAPADAPGRSATITLNLVNADVRDAARVILGDYLKRNYTIGGNVQANVTIQTSTPIALDSVLPLFEQALRLNGLALLSNGGVYRIIPLADAAKEAVGNGVISPSNPGQPGFGIQIVSLKFVSAAEIARLLTPLSPAQAVLQIDAVRNAIIIQGTERERAALLDTIALFDVDWLAGMSFALYSPRYTDAQGLARELSQILGGANSPIGGIVRLVPIERLNAVLAISPQVMYLQELQQWVERLDHPAQGSDRRIFVYSVQNGRASDLAAVLVKVLANSTSQQIIPPIGTGGAVLIPPQASIASPQGGSTPGPLSVVAPPAPPSGPAPQPIAPTNISITADERNNALVIMASPQEYSAIESALRELDTVPLQVLLEAAIAEVTLTDDLRYGVQYFYRPGTNHEFVLSTGNTSTIAPTFPGFSYSFAEGANIKIILDALASVTRVDVVSSPELLVLNNQAAVLQVGDQVPIVTQTAVSTLTTGAPLVNNVQYHDTGVILRVTPRVNKGGMVMMDISQEVSNVAPTTSSTIDSPTIKQRKIESTVAVKDNETIALGGLITDSTVKGRDGIPILQSLPIIGGLFSTTENNKGRTELMVLITPHVLDSIEKARTTTEELRRKLPTIQYLFERIK